MSIIIIIVIIIAAAERIKQRTTYVGQTVKLPCRTTASYYVDWRRLKTLRSDHAYIYFNGHVTPAYQSRFSVEIEKTGTGDVYTLVIADVQLNDSVFYLCIEDAGLGNRHFFRLNVTGRLLEQLGSLNMTPTSAAAAAAATTTTTILLTIVMTIVRIIIG